MASPSADPLEIFFKVLFGQSARGYVCVAFLQRHSDPKENKLHEEFYRYPEDLSALIRAVRTNKLHVDTYFCPQLLEQRKRRKGRVYTCTAAWADLDECSPEHMLVDPSIIVESSPGKYQAMWVFEDPQPPAVAEDLSRRIAYHHAPQGADKSGWDLTQLLRVPYTLNLKYATQPGQEPLVRIIDINRNKYRLSDFSGYPEVKGSQVIGLPIPEKGELPKESALDVLQRHRPRLNPVVFNLYSVQPEDDWSGALWKLLMYCFEAGMSREEVFYVALSAACNKYLRDGRPPEYLWKDVCRAFVRGEEHFKIVVPQSQTQRGLLTDSEYALVATRKTFVERYIEWASGLGDAAPQYHQTGAFVLLSSILAGHVRLPTSFGTYLLNLWFMILADTTLTRKSTAMDIATDLLIEIDEDAVMATDGSLEGLMQSLSTRPGRPSIFLRDEFSGLLELMTKRDYYAGMAELLTKLYDGRLQRRVLRREIIEIREPVMILYAGGIRNRVQQLLTLDHVSSGFIPRFVFVTAESDVSRVAPLGPPRPRDLSGRSTLIEELRNMSEHYTTWQEVVLPNKSDRKIRQQVKWDAELTGAAWTRYAQFETDMLEAGMQSERPDVTTPMYDRLAKSTLKAATLIAASRQRGEGVTVEVVDLLHAIMYCQQWREYANEVINGIGKSSYERDLERIYNAIVRRPGISRSKLMQNYHLTAKTADAIFTTLEQRGVVTKNAYGRGSKYYAVEGLGL